MQSKRLDIKKAILLIMNYLIGYLYLTTKQMKKSERKRIGREEKNRNGL